MSAIPQEVSPGIDLSRMVSRRRFIAEPAKKAVEIAAVLGAGFPTSAVIVDQLTSSDIIESAYDFPFERRQEILPGDPLYRELYDAPIQVTRLEGEYEEKDGNYSGYFTVPESEKGKTHVELRVSGQPTDVISKNPMLLSLSNDRRFFVPFIQSIQPTNAHAYFGTLPPGEYAWVLDQLDATEALRSDGIQISVVAVEGSSIQEMLWAGSPKYALFPDNMKDIAQHDGRLWSNWFDTPSTDDMPFLDYCNVYRFEDKIMLENTLVRSSQNKGWNAKKRIKEKKGVTLDSEWSARQIQSMDGIVEDESLQGDSHVPIRLEDGQAPQKDGEQAEYQIEKANGTYSYQVKTDVFLSQRRNITRGIITVQILVAANPALQYLGYMEEAATPSPRGLANGKELAEQVLREMQAQELPSYPQYPATPRVTGLYP